MWYDFLPSLGIIFLTWLIIDTTSIALASLLVFFWFFDNKRSVYRTNYRRTLFAFFLCLKWSIVRVERFSYVNFIFFFCNINHHIKMIAFLSATKACRSKMTSVSLEFYFGLKLHYLVLVTDFDTKWCFIFPIKVTKFS
jgi:hypothetical protein